MSLFNSLLIILSVGAALSLHFSSEVNSYATRPCRILPAPPQGPWGPLHILVKHQGVTTPETTDNGRPPWTEDGVLQTCC